MLVSVCISGSPVSLAVWISHIAWDRKVDENRYIECFICEQNLIGVGIGVACRDRTIAFASTFACFLTRAFDNLRMGVISQTNLNVMGR